MYDEYSLVYNYGGELEIEVEYSRDDTHSFTTRYENTTGVKHYKYSRVSGLSQINQTQPPRHPIKVLPRIYVITVENLPYTAVEERLNLHQVAGGLAEFHVGGGTDASVALAISNFLSDSPRPYRGALTVTTREVIPVVESSYSNGIHVYGTHTGEFIFTCDPDYRWMGALSHHHGLRDHWLETSTSTICGYELYGSMKTVGARYLPINGAPVLLFPKQSEKEGLLVWRKSRQTSHGRYDREVRFLDLGEASTVLGLSSDYKTCGNTDAAIESKRLETLTQKQAIEIQTLDLGFARIESDRLAREAEAAHADLERKLKLDSILLDDERKAQTHSMTMEAARYRQELEAKNFEQSERVKQLEERHKEEARRHERYVAKRKEAELATQQEFTLYKTYVELAIKKLGVTQMQVEQAFKNENRREDLNESRRKRRNESKDRKAEREHKLIDREMSNAERVSDQEMKAQLARLAIQRETNKVVNELAVNETKLRVLDMTSEQMRQKHDMSMIEAREGIERDKRKYTHEQTVSSNTTSASNGKSFASGLASVVDIVSLGRKLLG